MSALQLVYTTTGSRQTVVLQLSSPNVTIAWGDASSNNVVASGLVAQNHIYNVAGTYTVQITGTLSGFGNTPGVANAAANVRYLKQVQNFGSIGLTYCNLSNATGLTSVPNSIPASLTNLSGMFQNCTNFNSNISNWDVTNVTNMSSMLRFTAFNQNLGSWNVSNVTNMQNMLDSTAMTISNFESTIVGWSQQTLQQNVNFDAFGREIANPAGYEAYTILTTQNGWIITGVAGVAFSLSYTIVSPETEIGVYYTNPNLTIDWGDGTFNVDVSNVIINRTHTYSIPGTYIVSILGTLSGFGNTPGLEITAQGIQYLTGVNSFGAVGMTYCNFSGASALTSVPAYFPSSITNATGLFNGCSAFNDTNVLYWNVSQVTNMNSAFKNATSFDQNIGVWNVTSVTNMANMLDSAILSDANFSATLLGWSQQAVASGVTLGASGRSLTNSNQVGYLALVTQKRWQIIGIAGAAFQLTYTIPNPNVTIQFILSTPNVTVNWGDGVSEILDSSGESIVSHTYSSSGTYAINMYGTLAGFGRAPGTITYNYAQNIQYLTNVGSFGVVGLTYCNFQGAGNLLSVPSSIPPSITTAYGMFQGCSSLNDSNLVGWEMSNVTIMDYMFSGCTAFNQPIGNWNVSNVTSMQFTMGCQNFNQDLSGWNVSKVTNMQGMFNSYGTFTNINVGGWNVSNVTNMQSMFGAGTFNGDISGWNVGNVTNFREMFASNALFNQPIGGWDVSKATNMYAMFSNAWKFNQDISNWNVSNVTDLGSMFYIPAGFGSTSKFNQPIGKWNTISATNMGLMFFGANEFAQDLSGWNLANCTDINNMFAGTAIENVNLQNWNLSKVRNMASLFEGCSKFNSPSIINWDVSGVINMSAMFKSTPFNQNIGGWNVGNATIMDGIFQNSAFNQNIGGWNVGNVTLMNSMFEDNAGFNHNIASWNVSKVIQMKKMFRNASAFNQNIGAWSITSLEPTGYFGSAEEMFDNCGLSESNFSEILYGWSLKSVKRNVTLGTLNLYYSAPRGSQGYNTLTNTYGWTINSFVKPMRLTYSIPVANAVTSLYLGVSGSVTVNWGDGGSNVVTTSSRVSHTFANPGTYSATIVGKFATSVFQFGGGYGYVGDNAKYLSQVLDYGAFNLTSLGAAYAFRQTDLTYLPPLPSTVTNIEYIFTGCSGQLADITGWNTANVTSMRSAFQDFVNFNQNIGGWNVGNVTMMDGMFSGARKFNQPIGGWNVSKVTSMILMFYYATEFNQNISGWNVGNVTDMTYMFVYSNFNQPINNWNVGKVKYMTGMFIGSKFNQPVNNWNVSKVTSFFRMFYQATNFNQTIVNWNMSSLLPAFYGGILGMFQFSALNQDLGALNITYVDSLQETLSNLNMSAENWGNTLYGWSQQAVKPNVYISTDGLRYNDKSLLAYNILTSPPNNWTFAGGIIDPINLTFVTPSTNRIVEIYLGITPSNTITINWGDTTTSSITSTQGISHTYSTAGTYTVTISASKPNAIFQFGDPTTTRKSTYLTHVNSWGSFVLTSLAGAFNSNQGTLISVPTLPSTVTNVTGMFQYATDMSLNISSWDVSKVTNMSYMFAASTSQVSSYSPDISSWNTQSATNMSYMFASNRTFNRNIGGWNTANVTNMSNMFYQGANVATPFNQSLANWNVAKVTNMTNMLSYTAMTVDNFSNTLYSWAQQAVRPNVTLGADNLFCNSKGITGANTLTNTTNNWTIIGIISEPAKLTFVTPSSNCATAIYLGVNTSNSVTIDWGDSSSNVISTTQGISHTYDAQGTYVVTITASSTNAIYQFGDPSSVYISTYLTRVDSWGAFNLTSLAGAFNSIQGTLVYVPPLPPAVTDLTATFKYATDMSLNLSSWDVSGITNMSYMFAGNGAQTTYYNPNVSGWNTKSVTNMSSMFASNKTFNQNIASWNTGNVTNMDNMFYSAIRFNQNVGAWNVAKVTSMVNMLSYTAMSTENVGNTLYGWSLQAVRTGVALGASSLSFKTSAGIQGYKTLTNTRSWNITGLSGVNFQLSYTIPAAATLIEFFLTTPNVTIDWGDGSSNVVNASGGLVTTGHTYSTAGTYAINIAGSLGGFGYTTDSSDSIATNIQYLTQVVDFGILGMTYCNFIGASNLISVPSLFADTVTNLYGMFSGCARFNDSAILNWDVSNATKMSKMFQNAVAFNQNIGAWNVANLTNASSMFYGATAFNQNIGAWNVTNLTNASSMFYGATTFNQNIGVWNTIGVTNASSMFQNATAFNQDISGWNVANVTNTSSMFQNATAFNQNIGGWNVANVTNAASMFQNATTFNQNIGAWNMSNVTNTSSMFYGAAAFNQNIGSWNLSNLTNASSMFQNAATFNQNIGSWNLANLTNASSMFQNASMFNGDVSGWNVTNVTNMSGMFSGASAFNKNVGVWSVANVTNMSGLFKQAVAFNQNLNDWIVSNVENMSDMFNGAAIFNADLSAWDTSKVTTMARMFANATAFDKPIENWNVSNVTNLSGMFSNATAFNQPLGFWDTTNVTDMSMLFSGATSFAQSVSDWITSNVTNLNGVFQYYPFNEDVSRWDTSNVTNMGRAFFMAENFDQYLGGWNMTKVTNAVDMLKGISMSPANVNNTLYGWSSQTPINQNLYIGFDGFYTSVGAPYFNKLVNIYKWTFSGMALFANVAPMQLVYSVDSSNLTITVPIATATKTVVIDWGDGSTTIAPNTNLLTSAFYHTYSSPNSYTVKIMPPSSTSVYGFGSSSIISAARLTSISTYGGLALTSLGGAFAGASNLSSMPAFPASVTDVNNMFWSTSNITINFSAFDVSKITNMSSMFRGINYNPAVSNWNTANVTNMANMFNGSSNFNRSLGLWNVTKVTNMSNMLSYTGISANIFSDTIYRWSLQSVRSNVSLGAAGAFVTPLGYQSMVTLSSSPKFWNITGVSYFPTALTQYSGYPFSFVYLNVDLPVISGHVYNLTDMSSGDIVSTFSPTGDVSSSLAFEFNNVTLYTSGVRNLAIQDASNGNATIFQVPITFNIVCFKEDTKILCLKYDKEEYVPIQNLRKGDLVKTLLSGYVPIDMIGKTSIYNEGVSDRIKDQLYVCKRAKYPELFEDLYITGAHSILVDKLSKKQKEQSLELFDKICLTETKYRLMACVDERAVPYETAGNFNIYHIALANDEQYSNYGVYANGLLVESCSKRFLRELSNMTIRI